MDKIVEDIKVSFIVPVYNTEEYVAETIDSLINQDIGFEDSCEIIIIDDGSVDNSGVVCKEFIQKYPGNIRYSHQKNQGVSSAMNAGMRMAKGKYISFIGSDDKISPDAARISIDFLEKNHKSIDFVAIKMELFEAMSGPHPLNYKFSSTRVIDIEKEFDSIILASGGVFIKRSVVNAGMYFDENLTFYEDAAFLTEVVLKKGAYGVVSEPTYFYRKRLAGNSLVGSKSNNKHWYLETTEKVHQRLFDLSLRKLGRISKYVQCVVMYDLQWQIKLTEKPPLNKDELKIYYDRRHRLLKEISDEVIVAQKFIFPEHKVHCLSLKYGTDIMEKVKYKENNKLFYNDLEIFDGNSQTVRLEFISIEDNKLVIEGWYGGISTSQVHAYITFGNKKYVLTYNYRPDSEVYSQGVVIYRYNSFKVSIPLTKESNSIFFYIGINNESVKAKIEVRRFTYLSNLQDSFRSIDRKVLVVKQNWSLFVQPYSHLSRLKKEIKYSKRLILNKKSVVVGYRIGTYLYRLLKSKKKIWLITDRPDSAGDNAEYLFRYISKNIKRKDVRFYFAVSKKESTFKYLRKIGKVINYHSVWYRLNFLVADIRISSMFDEYVINCFGEDGQYLRDLFRFKYIYINHGILTSDSSGVYGRNKKNATLITVGTRFEKSMMLANPNYGYSEEQIVVTGLPRFDPLKVKTNTNKKILLFMPTWRSQIAGAVNTNKFGQNSGVRSYNDLFTESNYFKFYDSLLKDDRINSALKEYGYRIKFCIHPSLFANWSDFTSSSLVEICRPPHNYVKLLNEGSIMVTDYSGVAFDFAYRGRSVIYSQYDKERIFEEHYYKQGDYSFLEQGFGDVTFDYETTVDAIVEQIKRGGVMRRKYKQRAKKFFDYKDNNSAARVYQAIVDIEKK